MSEELKQALDGLTLDELITFALNLEHVVSDKEERQKALALLIQAAEQRGADRAFEEAERYRTLAEAALECEYPHLRELARLVIRQRIGEK